LSVRRMPAGDVDTKVKGVSVEIAVLVGEMERDLGWIERVFEERVPVICFRRVSRRRGSSCWRGERVDFEAFEVATEKGRGGVERGSVERGSVESSAVDRASSFRQ